jgi:ribonucleoside-diphosphate reductase alpha chain
MWENRRTFNGLAVLPYDNGIYTQAPFEDIDEDLYKKMERYLTRINLTSIKEETDETNLNGQVACSGGACEIV